MKNIIITILAVLVVAMGGYLVWDKVIDKKEVKEDNIEKSTTQNSYDEELTVSEEVLKELKDILNIPSGEDVWPFVESFVEGKISNYSKDQKKYIIFRYAKEHNLLASITQESLGIDSSGSGYVDAVKKEDYYKISKKYNIEDSFEELYGSEIYKENSLGYVAVYSFGGFSIDGTYKHIDVSAKYEGDYIVLYDTLEHTFEDGSKQTTKKKFTFNKLSDGSYALYSVENN